MLKPKPKPLAPTKGLAPPTKALPKPQPVEQQKIEQEVQQQEEEPIEQQTQQQEEEPIEQQVQQTEEQLPETKSYKAPLPAKRKAVLKWEQKPLLSSTYSTKPKLAAADTAPAYLPRKKLLKPQVIKVEQQVTQQEQAALPEEPQQLAQRADELPQAQELKSYQNVRLVPSLLGGTW